MCGRYGLVGSAKAMKERFDLAYDLEDFQPRYNVAPSQWMPVVVRVGNVI
jgi:putative SOS response-associated peptidase YedK